MVPPGWAELEGFDFLQGASVVAQQLNFDPVVNYYPRYHLAHDRSDYRLAVVDCCVHSTTENAGAMSLAETTAVGSASVSYD